ncbi:hypothetical protein Sme01_26100 [Sphaerisporangium melleum]|uniref:Uncharacterized protein n=1 Tax=Sphaerisporangium melleum TaxID=321316 RepID=A0A917QVS8_9ACTN|nr:hypothetical protein GCM10007964_13230 [Sphaerisporangium melleum]GII70134.1 hypothetical protein Sme01_26100 [Sphaerisporangium melleum]
MSIGYGSVRLGNLALGRPDRHLSIGAQICGGLRVELSHEEIDDPAVPLLPGPRMNEAPVDQFGVRGKTGHPEPKRTTDPAAPPRQHRGLVVLIWSSAVGG